MTLAQIIPLLINISIVLIVFALGLKTERGDALYLLSRPLLLLRSIVSMNVIMVGVAVAMAAALDLPFTVELALVALAISPVPPILPGKQRKAGGSASYAISLLAVASFAAIALAPIAVDLTSAIFGRTATLPTAAVTKVVLVSVIAPLLAGIAIRFLLPDIGARFAGSVSTTGTVLLVIAVLPVLISATAAIWPMIGNGVLLALIAFSLIGLAVGHLLGGRLPENRTVLALATSTRHPGIAMAIVTLNFPDEKATLAIVLYHLVIGAIVSLPYVKWRRAATQPESVT